jgi:DNA transformation protein
MAVSSEYLQYVLEQLSGLGAVTARRMFGGVGLYRDLRFFGIITSDTLYFKVDDSNRQDYVALGMGAFRPYPDKPHLSMSYFEVPADTLEDPDQCAAWARKSVALASTKPQAARKKPKPNLARAPCGRNKKRQ